MAAARPNVRWVALLVYALVVNAFVWATSAIARPVGLASVLCHTTAEAPTSPGGPAKAAAHDCCDMACGTAAVFAPPAMSIALMAPAIVDASAATLSAEVSTPIRGRPWPTGPPAR